MIVDATTGDNDTLNVTLSAADITGLTTVPVSGPTISRIENVNVNIDAFAGTATTLDAGGISAGTKLTFSSSKPGYDGAAGVTTARGVNVVAGSGVVTLTVDSLTSGTVDAGSANTVNITADSTRTDTARIKVNGDVVLNYTDLAGGVVRNAVIEATKAAVVNVTTTGGTGGNLSQLGIPTATAPGLITTTGAGKVTIRGDAADLTARSVNHTGSGDLAVRVNDAVALDVSNYKNLKELIVPAAYAGTATVQTGMTITPRPGVQSYNGSTFNNAESQFASVQGSSLNVTLGGNGSNAMVFGGFETVNFTQSSSQSLTANAPATNAITQNAAAAGPAVTGTLSLTFKGAGDLSIAAPTVTNVLDASGIAGGLTYSPPAAGAQKVLGGAGTNVITSAAAAQLDYVGQNGGDVINAPVTTGLVTVKTGSGADALRIAPAAAAITGAGSVVADLGAGNDLVTVGLTAASATAAGVAVAYGSGATTTGAFVLDAGAGTDTLRIATGTSLFSGTLTTNTLNVADAGLTNTVGNNLAQLNSSVKGFERIELQESDLAGRIAIRVNAGTFLLNGSDATVAVRYGSDAAGARYTTEVTTNLHRLTLDDMLGGAGGTASNVTARNVDLSKVKFDITRLVDQLVVNTGAGNDVITLPTTLAGQSVRVNSGGGNDQIIVGDGPGVVNVVLGAGSKTVDLSKSTSANVIVFDNGTGAVAAAPTGVHSITGWKPQTLLDLEAYAANNTAFGGAAVLGVLGNRSALTTDLVTVISTTGAAANLTLEGGAAITNFRSAEQVAGYLGERYSLAGAERQIFALNDTSTGANKSYIWQFVNGATNPTAFDASEFALLAVVDNGGIGLTTANFTAIDQAALVTAAGLNPTNTNETIWIA